MSSLESRLHNEERCTTHNFVRETYRTVEFLENSFLRNACTSPRHSSPHRKTSFHVSKPFPTSPSTINHMTNNTVTPQSSLQSITPQKSPQTAPHRITNGQRSHHLAIHRSFHSLDRRFGTTPALEVHTDPHNYQYLQRLRSGQNDRIVDLI